MSEQLYGPLGRLQTMAAQARSIADRVPGKDFAVRQARVAEDLVVEELRRRLERQEGTPGGVSADAAPQDLVHTEHGTPGEAFQSLMDRAFDQKPDTAATSLYLRLVKQLLPDEARILAALSNGEPTAICHLEASNRLGTESIPVLLNVNRVGHEAGVMLAARSPYYIGNLRDMGLVDTGHEDKTLANRYELIESDSAVRAAWGQIEQNMKLRPRLTRATAYISPLGQDLWQACYPGGD